MTVGGWELVDMKACDLPEKVASGFAEIMSTWEGADLTPVLYCGTQTVNGVNHMIICRENLVVQGTCEKLVKVIVHEDAADESKSNFSILTIDTICG